MNKLFITGNVVKDPDCRTTTSGINVCSFTVAVNRRHQKDEADFFRVSAWRALADVCEKYVKKGMKITVIGTVSVSTFKDKNGETRASADVNADDIEFLTKPKTEEQHNGYQEVTPEDSPWG